MGVNWVIATDCAANNDDNVQQELWSPTFSAGAACGICRVFEGQAGAEASGPGRTHSALSSWSASEALLDRVWAVPVRCTKFRVGQIAVNALANLIVWDTDHPAFWPPVNPLRNLAMADPVGAIHSLIVAGRGWVHR